MSIRFIALDGTERQVETSLDLAAAIQSGELDENSPMFDHRAQRWSSAGEHEVFRMAISTAASNVSKQVASGESASRQPWWTGDSWLFALAFGGSGLILIFLPEATGPIEAQIGYALGAAIWTVLVPYFFMRRTAYRSFFPVVAILLSGGYLVTATALRKERNQQIATDLEVMADLVVSPLSEDTPIPPVAMPSDIDGKYSWVSRMALQDYRRMLVELAAEHGIDPDVPPEEWITPAYLADAADYPHVREWLSGYRSYLTDAISQVPDLMRQATERRLDEAGISGYARDEYFVDLMRGYKSNADAGEFAFAVAENGIRLHDFLVSVDERVYLSPDQDQALFEVDAERAIATQLLNRIDEASTQYLLRREAVHERMQTSADSILGL